MAANTRLFLGPTGISLSPSDHIVAVAVGVGVPGGLLLVTILVFIIVIYLNMQRMKHKNGPRGLEEEILDGSRSITPLDGHIRQLSLTYGESRRPSLASHRSFILSINNMPSVITHGMTRPGSFSTLPSYHSRSSSDVQTAATVDSPSYPDPATSIASNTVTEKVASSTHAAKSALPRPGPDALPGRSVGGGDEDS
ncbi:hypothetical protein BDW22DRAFT_1429634 [Trametopsis cervina]|nr:hypothetical protein BDW22DRAFT_1429634 [Trametopsis cervina]